MGLFRRAPNAETQDEPVDQVPRLGELPPLDDDGRCSFDDYRDYLLGLAEPLTPFGMSLIDAWGRTLCEDIKGYGDVPPVAVAEVDGYAISFADAAKVKPGVRPTFSLAGAPRRAVTDDESPQEGDDILAITDASTNGRAVRVRAGEDMPAGTDTVVSNDDVIVDTSGIQVTLRARAIEGDWVRAPGTEAKNDELLMAAGTVLDDRSAALLAAAGFDRVLARPRTRVAIVRVNDSQTQRSDGGRRGSYGVNLISGAAQADGASVWRAEIDLVALDAARERLSDELVRSDMVMTIGGLSNACADPRLISLLGEMGDVEVMSVAMQPGCRHGFGVIGDDDTPVVMLPDDATALLVAYHAFARPVLRKLMGTEPFAHEPMLCFAERDFDSAAGITQLVPCRLRQDGNRYLASEIVPRRHSWLTTLVAADALVVLPAGKHRLYAGEAMACWLLGDQRAVVG